MKKKVWLLGVAVAALTSCTENEVLEIPESRVIGFESFVDKPTRATSDVADNYFTHFWVYATKTTNYSVSQPPSPALVGTQVFDEQPENVSRTITYVDEMSNPLLTPEKGPWSYEGDQINDNSKLHAWETDKLYRFAAYSAGNQSLNPGVTFYDAMDITPTVPVVGPVTPVSNTWGLTFTNYQASNQVDLMAAVSSQRDLGDVRDVNLTFKHLLAKVCFKFDYSSLEATTNYKMQVDEIVLNATKTATCNVYYHPDYTTYIDWKSQFISASSATESYSFFENGREIFVNIPVEDACYVIPQGNEYKVDITISTFENTGTSQDPVWTKRDTKTYDDVDLTLQHGEYNIWQPGFVYRYTAELNPTTHVIRFTADASKWTDDIEDDKDISE
ncbi:MAG: hypothetical protein E7096_06530 [Bacteroides sp.]|nr:hypothetical protein [Bacteroides sp.]